MDEKSAEYAALERRIEYLSVQIERLIELQSPFSSPMTAFRKVAMFHALTFEQEALARKLLGAIHAFNNGEEVDINQGLLPFPRQTVDLFHKYTNNKTIDPAQVKELLKTVVHGGDSAAQSLLEAWEVAQQQIRYSEGEHH